MPLGRAAVRAASRPARDKKQAPGTDACPGSPVRGVGVLVSGRPLIVQSRSQPTRSGGAVLAGSPSSAGHNYFMDVIGIVLPIITLLVGGLVTFGADSVRHRRSRRESISDSLMDKRAEAYLSFVEATHDAAHRLGRSAPGSPNPISDDAYWLVDSQVVLNLRKLELVGTDGVVRNAHVVRMALRAFRDHIKDGAVYGSPEYQAAYAPVTAARDALVAAARLELKSRE